MTESSLSVLGDPWNSPSAMAITPPLLTKSKLTPDKLPVGSTEWQKIMIEMYTELEMERRIRGIIELDSMEDKKSMKATNKILTRISTRESVNMTDQRKKHFRQKETKSSLRN